MKGVDKKFFVLIHNFCLIDALAVPSDLHLWEKKYLNCEKLKSELKSFISLLVTYLIWTLSACLELLCSSFLAESIRLLATIFLTFEPPFTCRPQASAANQAVPSGCLSPDRGESTHLCNGARDPLKLPQTHTLTQLWLLTSDLHVPTPEHLISLSQALTCFSSQHLLYSFFSFVSLFIFFKCTALRREK